MKEGSPSDHFHVIDTSVVVALMEGEPEAERFERVIEMATHRTIAAPSVLEAMMVLTRLRGADSAAIVSAELAAHAVEIVAFGGVMLSIAFKAFWQTASRGIEPA
ncbi:MAG: type II toxin-antitoxin system VapC family toxin [Myxococcota bacterium]